MDVVMFHSGKELPAFLEDCLRQFCHFNPFSDIYFLTDNMHLGNSVFSKYEVDVRNKDDYYSENITRFKVLYGRGADDFWTITSTRLFYIANFLKEEELKDICLFENDVLIYEDLSKYDSLFPQLYKNLAITVGGQDKCMTGFMFIKNAESLLHMINFFMNMLKTTPVKEVKRRYGMDMVNEMTLMRVYSKEYPERMQLLPILPSGEFSENFSVFNSVFDPASWGQFVGGTLSEGPGAMPQDHYIGRLLKEHPDYTVIWKEGIPYFKYDEQEVKINNLHIHSKNLSKYMS